LRAKRRHEIGFFSRFYTVVSDGTSDMKFVAKRRQFLIDQGYVYRTLLVTDADLASFPFFNDPSKHQLLLEKIVNESKKKDAE
jgi:hypothetical protein